MIDRATIDKIMEATNIVDVVGEFVTLRKAGVNYKGLCPFHDDTTPSFMVSPSKQICKCFACGEGGTAINFLMKHEQITYPEALRWLAKKYNIEIQEKELTDEEKKEQSDRESMFVLNEWAMNYFNDLLKNDSISVVVESVTISSRSLIWAMPYLSATPWPSLGKRLALNQNIWRRRVFALRARKGFTTVMPGA